MRKSEVEIDVIDVSSSDGDVYSIDISEDLSDISDDFFTDNRDDLICWGELMKFKPGLSINFIPRYVQLSSRAFRYYRNKVASESAEDMPLVSIRRKFIQEVRPIQINKEAYLKKGA